MSSSNNTRICVPWSHQESPEVLSRQMWKPEDNSKAFLSPRGKHSSIITVEAMCNINCKQCLFACQKFSRVREGLVAYISRRKQSSSFSCYNKRVLIRLGCKHLLLRTKLSKVNRKIQLSRVKIGLQQIITQHFYIASCLIAPGGCISARSRAIRLEG